MLITTFVLKPIKRYAFFHSEQLFLISFGLLATLGYGVLFWLITCLWNARSANWHNLANTAIQLAKDLLTLPTLAPLVVGMLILFFLINLIRSGWQLFQAFWDSLEVD